ncbi:MAG: type 4a pilus biogenesis protein PilO [Phycisphaeraceae bacterium]
MNPISTAHWKLWRIYATGAAVCAALTVAVYFAGIRPVFHAHQHRTLQQAKLKDQRRLASELAASLSTLRRDVASVTQALDESPLRLEPAGHINQRLARLTELATNHGLEIHQIQPGQVQRDVHYDIVPVHLAGEGTYQTYAAFIHQLHRKFPDTGVSSFELSGNPSDPDDTATFRLNLAWYTIPAAGSVQD